MQRTDYGPKSKSTEACGIYFQDERGEHESGYETILIVYIRIALHFEMQNAKINRT